MSDNLHILLGEDPAGFDEGIKARMISKGIRPAVCVNGIELVRKAVLKQPDVIIIDVSLSRMNGYQCARLLKHDAVTRHTPVIHVGTSASPVDRYWSKICGGDAYVQSPVDMAEMMAVIDRLGREAGSRRRPVTRGSILSEMSDRAILGLATNLMEQELLRLNILKEINMVDIPGIDPRDLTASLFAIIHSLYPFTCAAALLIYDRRAEYYFCPSREDDAGRSDEIKMLMLDQIRRDHDQYIDPETVTDAMVTCHLPQEIGTPQGDMFIHVGEEGPAKTALAFENIDIEAYRGVDRSVLQMALELVQGVLEKTIFSRMSKELSMIDIATRGYSITFFMEVLEREMAGARRQGYSVTLFTMLWRNFPEMSETLDPEARMVLVRTVQGAVMKSTRKSDVVARWNQANFAILLTYTTREASREAVVRVKKTVMQDLAAIKKVDVRRLKLDFGIAQFHPDRHADGEALLKQAMPRKKQQ